MVNKKFRFTISFQFLVSTLVVCFTLYQLTRTSGKFIEIGLYMSCMLTQIFLYCWYGNEVKLKVSENTFPFCLNIFTYSASILNI